MKTISDDSAFFMTNDSATTYSNLKMNAVVYFINI